jgi:hypothetical protein
MKVVSLEVLPAPDDRLLLAYSIGSAHTDSFDLEVTASGKTVEFRIKSDGKDSKRYWVDITPLAHAAVEMYKKEPFDEGT